MNRAKTGDGYGDTWVYVNHMRAVMRDVAVVISLVLGAISMTYLQPAPDVPLEAVSTWRWKVSACLLTVVAYLLWNKTVGAYRPQYGTPSYRCVTNFGHMIFFDTQSLAFLFVHLLISTAAEGSLLTSKPYPGFYRIAYNLSPLVLCNTLVASFFVVAAKRYSGHPFGLLLLSPCVASVVALVDFLYVKHEKLILVMTPSMD